MFNINIISPVMYFSYSNAGERVQGSVISVVKITKRKSETPLHEE
jgi:hypothetical protein